VECPQKQQHAGEEGGKSDAKKIADAFLVHIIGVQEQTVIQTAGTMPCFEKMKPLLWNSECS
jgi:hypothetical protein